MSFVPSGKRKRMVAQSNMMIDGNSFGVFEDGTEMPNDMASVEDDLQPQTEQIPQEQPTDDGEPDLTEYIFKTLEKFGYPPRRLEEFEKEFVNEKIFSGGIREVEVVIPDRYYGTRKRISDNDFNQIVNDIQNSFGLIFNEAERKDKKINISFTSEKKEEEDDVQLGDDLDDVYGPSKDRKGKKKASSMTSIKHADNLYQVILDRNPDLRRQITGE